MINVKTLDVVIDLGSDSLKIAYGYKLPRSSKVFLGKFAGDNLDTQIGIPAVAFLSPATKTWLFGNQVEASGESDFTTVVRIKSLMSLLARIPDKAVWKSNEEYYFRKRRFPKFYLPKDKQDMEAFAKMEETNRTFDGGKTPQAVCEEFFLYVAGIVAQGVRELQEKKELNFLETHYSVVYPSKVGSEYVSELVRIVEKTFRTKVSKSLSSVKALGMYAFHNGMVANGERFLVFDIGEEYVSVAKGWFTNGQMYIDGQEGHKTPAELGGTKIDEAMREYLESSIVERETFVTPSYGQTGHINEGCMDSKKYQLLKDLKSAKRILSSPISDDELYEKGVPLLICRDTYVQRFFTKKELTQCLGILNKSQTGAAWELAKYIDEEVSEKINDDVQKVFIAGGVIETYSLDGFIKSLLQKSNPSKTVLTFDDEQGLDEDGALKIYANESSVYAAVLGGSVVAVNNLEIKTVLSLSYGTWAYVGGTEPKVFSQFANKGQELNANKPTKFYNASTYSYQVVPFHDKESRFEGIEEDEIFSTIVTKEDILAGRESGKTVSSGGKTYRLEYKLDFNGKRHLSVGNEKSSYRIAAEQIFKLKSVVKSDIWFYHGGRRVRIRKCLYDTAANRQVLFKEGIVVDTSGVAEPIVENVSESFNVTITYWDVRTKSWTETKTVNVQEIKLDFKDKKTIVVESNQD